MHGFRSNVSANRIGERRSPWYQAFSGTGIIRASGGIAVGGLDTATTWNPATGYRLTTFCRLLVVDLLWCFIPASSGRLRYRPGRLVPSTTPPLLWTSMIFRGPGPIVHGPETCNKHPLYQILWRLRHGEFQHRQHYLVNIHAVSFSSNSCFSLSQQNMLKPFVFNDGTTMYHSIAYFRGNGIDAVMPLQYWCIVLLFQNMVTLA